MTGSQSWTCCTIFCGQHRAEYFVQPQMHPPAGWDIAKDHEQVLRTWNWEKPCLCRECGAFRGPVYDKRPWCWSILGTYFNGIKGTISSLITASNAASASSPKEEALRQFILHDLHSGATMYEAIGAYNLETQRDHYHRGQERISEADELYQPGRPQGFCYHLQCVQHAASAQDLDRRRAAAAGLCGLLFAIAAWYTKSGNIKAHGGKSMLTYTHVSRQFELMKNQSRCCSTSGDAIVKVTTASICSSDLAHQARQRAFGRCPASR